MSDRKEFAAAAPINALESNTFENVDARSGLLDRTQAMAGKTVLQDERNGAENIKLSDKAKAAIDLLFATPKSMVQYAEGKVGAFLMDKTPVGTLAKCLHMGVSSGLPSDIKQIAHGKTETPSLREIIANNVKDSTKQAISQLSKRER